MTVIVKHIDDRGVATLTLNRPDVHNAFNAEMIAALHDAYASLGKDDAVRVITLVSAGKSFSAGADLVWMKAAANYTQQENIADAQALSDMLNAIYSCPKPTLALVEGLAMGGGVGLVSAVDIAVATPTAKFALSEVKLGLTPATISPFVINAIGAKMARRLFLTAEMFDAHAAANIGLVAEVSEDGEKTLEDFITALLGNAPEALTAAKQLINDVAGKPITDTLRAETARAIAERRASDEGREGIVAFLAKRKPNWIKE